MDDPTLDKYRRATEGFDAVVRAVPADQWEAQSPCAEWKAVDVLGHVIGSTEMVRARALGDEPSVDWTRNRERIGADPVAAWTAARDAALAALTPEALERRINTGMMGEVPLRQVMGLFISDMTIHTWDLATAIGQPVRLDPELVRDTFAMLRAAPPDMMRGPNGFAPELPAPEDADEQTRMLAFAGRRAG